MGPHLEEQILQVGHAADPVDQPGDLVVEGLDPSGGDPVFKVRRHGRQVPQQALGEADQWSDAGGLGKRSTGGISLPGAWVAYTPVHAFSLIRLVRRSGQPPRRWPLSNCTGAGPRGRRS